MVACEISRTGNLAGFTLGPCRKSGEVRAWILEEFLQDHTDAKEAIGLLNEQIKQETGETAEAIYLHKVAQAVPELPEPMTPVEAGAKGGRGKKAIGNTNSFKNVGSAYILGRLKRDYPDLAERVVAGEMSANAAAYAAGFRKKPVKRCPKCEHA